MLSLLLYLSANSVGFKISFINVEIQNNLGDGFAILKSFYADMYFKFREAGLIKARAPYFQGIDDVYSHIRGLFEDFHIFAINQNLRVLLVFDEIQSFFQSEETFYVKMVQLFKSICIPSSLKWTRFFFFFTGSGMAMAWRGFKSSSVQGFPLYTEMKYITIESNSSLEIKKIVVDKFMEIYNCADGFSKLVPACFMNPACIAWYCVFSRDNVLKIPNTRIVSQLEQNKFTKIFYRFYKLLLYEN